MSLAAILKRARKAVKSAIQDQNDNKNQYRIHYESEDFDNNPAGALVIVLKDLEMDSSDVTQEAE